MLTEEPWIQGCRTAPVSTSVFLLWPPRCHLFSLSECYKHQTPDSPPQCWVSGVVTAYPDHRRCNSHTYKVQHCSYLLGCFQIHFFFTLLCSFPDKVLLSVLHLRVLQHGHNEVVHLIEHHKMDGQARAAVLGRRVTGQPGKGVVLLQHKSENIRGLIGVQRVRVFAV